MPLRGPHHLRETFEHRVLRGMLVAVSATQALVLRTDAGRLVDRNLLRDREVQRQVQERIDVAAFGRKLPLDVRVGRFQQRVILRVPRNDGGSNPLQRGSGLALSALFPGSIRKRRASTRDGLNIDVKA